MGFLSVMLLIFTGFMETTSDRVKVVGPTVNLVVKVGEDLVLPCSIQPSTSAVDMTVEWIRTDLTDTLVHLYKDRKETNDKQSESYRGRTALFKEVLHKGNTSLKLSAVQPSDEGIYQCYVESGDWYDDVLVHVDVYGKGLHSWKIAIICISVFSVMVLGFTACILKDKFSEKELSPAQCSFVAYTRVKSQYVREKLDLKRYNTSEESYRRLIPAMTNFKKAHFAGCRLTLKSIKTLSAALQTEDSSLKELDLSNNNLQDAGVELLCAGLRNSYCKLEILRLALCNFGEKSCEHLGSVLQTETSCLKELDLSNNELHDSGVQLLSTGLKSSHCKVEILRLALCHFKEKSCEHLGLVLQTETSSLKELDLSNNELHDSGVQLLSTGLKSSHCKVEILRLSLCNFGEKSCEHLGSVLQTETSCLNELDLSNNELHDSGVQLLSTGLKSSHCKVEILRLSGCMITEKGCSSLATAQSSNPSHLKELDLTYNHPGETGVKLLSARQKDPHCSLNTLRLEHGGENRIKPGLKKYCCQFTLDPNTASRDLSLSDRNRKVEYVGYQSYPDHPERFDFWDQILSRESVTGRCYWEAEWSGVVYIAVTYKSISRKGFRTDFQFGRNEKSWSLDCSDNSYIICHNNIGTKLSTRPSGCKRVGVYVDCPAGTLSFYRVSSDQHTLTHLYTFYTSFNETLHIGFWVVSNSSVCLI